jgi:2-methylcitrate dehydratase PrpD
MRWPATPSSSTTHTSPPSSIPRPGTAADLALAEQRQISGADLLHAFALGSMSPAASATRSRPATTRGAGISRRHAAFFGAAAASSRILALDAKQTAHALGIAASQASGIVENLPSGAKNIGIGNSARNGLLAAVLASNGYTAAPRAIEGPLGFAKAAGDTADMSELTGDLGKRWELLRNTYKALPLRRRSQFGHRRHARPAQAHMTSRRRRRAGDRCAATRCCSPVPTAPAWPTIATPRSASSIASRSR